MNVVEDENKFNLKFNQCVKKITNVN